MKPTKETIQISTQSLDGRYTVFATWSYNGAYSIQKSVSGEKADAEALKIQAMELLVAQHEEDIDDGILKDFGAADWGVK